MYTKGWTTHVNDGTLTKYARTARIEKFAAFYKLAVKRGNGGLAKKLLKQMIKESYDDSFEKGHMLVTHVRGDGYEDGKEVERMVAAAINNVTTGGCEITKVMESELDEEEWEVVERE